ncbi:MAG: 2-succinyl-6-hydroxy-2,4-cyclohexadiene-1-carboxylate synthase [Plectolyngbya sp. WJT66-NPBG17]|jgi:2-succinyl-6-hydroxy-2,4-cyclohexadiene-1-carboxylate synthase|nr:2-succinyl-6-hydroxy-2,4-cyclohexadiene-1-carboxylate synthase [Plectolyngbya sp. WJT66-NPBG17]MBW4524612.1 2-succinyl-6-hydroxy-2,4-cyclohexadiene-1-carboxylate synthase [Phormidium tanganyikae FI6-MK23]
MRNHLAFKFTPPLTEQIDSSIVIFLHGFLGSGAEFDPIVAQLPNRSLTIDLPGHGKTRFSEDYTIANTAAAIVDLLDELEIDQANLVGYSMGGRLGLYLALNYSQRFPAAVIESGSPGLKTQQERLERIQHDRELANQIESNFDQFLTDWYNQPLFRSIKAHPNFEQILKERSHNNPIELARSLREMGTGMQPSLWKQLQSHHNPLLLIVGECDRKFIALNQEMTSLCETAEIAIVPNAGHNIHVEQPEWFVDKLKNFFNTD